jgi:hypothetical protein
MVYETFREPLSGAQVYQVGVECRVEFMHLVRSHTPCFRFGPNAIKVFVNPDRKKALTEWLALNGWADARELEQTMLALTGGKY